MNPPVIEIAGVSKDYHALRPLRLHALSISAGEHVAVLGLDRPAAEVFINLITGAFLPDTGEIRVLGRPTAEVTDSADWLSLVDRFGIVSERAVLLDGLTTIQNLAMPFSLDIEPLGDDLRERARGMATMVGLGEADWERPVGHLDAAARLRVRLGRALALGPALVVLEHPSAALEKDERAGSGKAVRAVLERGGVDPGGPPPASLTLTADPEFAASVATRVLTLDPASGRLAEARRAWSLGRWGGRSVK